MKYVRCPDCDSDFNVKELEYTSGYSKEVTMWGIPLAKFVCPACAGHIQSRIFEESDEQQN